MVSQWRQKQKEELKRRLYDTAVQLFEDQGYEGTTVKQITEQVEVAKGTFFNHFATKEHVIEQWYSNITVKSLNAAKTRLKSNPEQEMEQAVADLFSEMAGLATAHPELLIAKAQNNSDPLLMKAEMAQERAIEQFILDLCRRAKERREIADDLDAKFFVDLLGVLLTGSSRAWVRNRFDFPAVIRRRVAFAFRAARVGQSAEQ